MMQNFDVEIHSVESLQVLQVVNSPLVSGNATITRVPEGSTFCLEKSAQKLLMVPFDPAHDIPKERRDEEVQIARRLATISSRIYIASTTALSSIITTPWFLQADVLLESNRVEEALALADKASQVMDDMQFDAERLVRLTLYLSHFKFHEIAYINQKAGFVLFRETRFEDALHHLEKANTDPRLIIRLFPSFTQVDISSIYLYSGIRDLLSSLANTESIGTLFSLFPFSSRKQGDGIVVNKLSRNYDPFIFPSSANAEATLELKRILLLNSQQVLRKYLFRYREKKGYASIGDDASKIFEWVDLVLLKLILEMGKEEGKQMLYELIDSGVDCFEQAENVLIENGRYYVLSRLYQSRAMTEKVLETWGKMIDGTWRDEEFRNGEERMRDYLMKIRDANLVFRFAMWLTQRNPEAGVQVI
jgi:vacuolar protein sorting-associated protein 3